MQKKINLLPIVYGVSYGKAPTALIYLAFLLCAQFKTTSFSDTQRDFILLSILMKT